MNKIFAWFWPSALLLGNAGCLGASTDDLSASAEDRLVAANSLEPNGIAPNGIAPNGIAPNGIAPNALTPSSISAASLASLRDPGAAGNLSRSFLRYAVGCAFAPSQTFAFAWTDGAGLVHHESYAGELGLAPYWAWGPLGSSGRQMVTACLLSRVNRFGVSVLVSLRSQRDPLDDQTTAAELAAYPYVEGAFWGDIFAEQPRAYSCYVQSDVAHSRAAQRTCAAGYVDPATGAFEECGIIDIRGSCSSVCNSFSFSHQAYSGCLDPAGGGRSQYVITSALP